MEKTICCDIYFQLKWTIIMWGITIMARKSQKITGKSHLRTFADEVCGFWDHKDSWRVKWHSLCLRRNLLLKYLAKVFLLILSGC